MPSPLPYEQISLDSDAFGGFAEVSRVDSPRIPHLLEQLNEDELAQRVAESDSVASKYQAELAKRGSSKTMSPDYIATLPSSMIEKLRLRPEEIEEILFHYASTSSIPKTIEATGYGRAKVHAVVYSPSSAAKLDTLRSAMRISVIRKIEETQLILLDALQSPTKLEDATLTQISDILSEVSTVATNLRSASQTESPFGNGVDPAAVYTGDELEYMAFLRRRLSAPSAPSASGGFADSVPGPSDLDPLVHGFASSMNGHEFIDPVFDVSSIAEELSTAVDEEPNADSIPH